MRTPDDELAIRALAASYADAVNRRDGDAMAAVYAPDGRLDVPGAGDPVIGREKLAKRFRRLVEREREFLMQLVHSGVVEIDGDRAKSRWYFTEIKKPVDGGFELVVGIYEDELVRLPEGWRYVTRRVSAPLRWAIPEGAALTLDALPAFLPIATLPGP